MSDQENLENQENLLVAVSLKNVSAKDWARIKAGASLAETGLTEFVISAALAQAETSIKGAGNTA